MFVLKTNPTFKASVSIPTPGGDPQTIMVTFRYRTVSEMEAWGKSLTGRRNEDVLPDIVAGWSDIVDADGKPIEFSVNALRAFLDQWPPAAMAIMRAYREELAGERLGN